MTATRQHRITNQPAIRQVVVVVRAEERGDDAAMKPGIGWRSRQ